jgi:hypothetical protein
MTASDECAAFTIGRSAASRKEYYVSALARRERFGRRHVSERTRARYHLAGLASQFRCRMSVLGLQ